MNTLYFGKDSITIPNTFFCTKSRYAYVKCALENAIQNQDVTLEIYDTRHRDAKIRVARKTNPQGIATFPIGSVAESLVKQFGAGIWVMFEALYEGGGVGTAACPIIGYSDYEIKALNDEAKNDPNATNYPAAKKIVIYPRAGFSQEVFVPASLDVTLTAAESGDFLAAAKGPFIQFEPSHIEGMGVLDTPGLEATIALSTGEKSIRIPADYDLCTEGVFLKWIDKSGMPYVYRWTLETVAEEMSVESAYTQLDDNLTPFTVHSKTLTKRYTLHSRIVEREIYEMCKTIIGCQELWMYDTNSADWIHCHIEDNDIEDSGSPMQDMIIEVVMHEYL